MPHPVLLNPVRFGSTLLNRTEPVRLGSTISVRRFEPKRTGSVWFGSVRFDGPRTEPAVGSTRFDHFGSSVRTETEPVRFVGSFSVRNFPKTPPKTELFGSGGEKKSVRFGSGSTESNRGMVRSRTEPNRKIEPKIFGSNRIEPKWSNRRTEAGSVRTEPNRTRFGSIRPSQPPLRVPVTLATNRNEMAVTNRRNFTGRRFRVVSVNNEPGSVRFDQW